MSDIEHPNKCLVVSDNEELDALLKEYNQLYRLTHDSWYWLFKTPRYHEGMKQLPIVTNKFVALARSLTGDTDYVMRRVNKLGYVLFWRE